MKQYGYMRISSKDQNPERQFLALLKESIPEKDMSQAGEAMLAQATRNNWGMFHLMA